MRQPPPGALRLKSEPSRKLPTPPDGARQRRPGLARYRQLRPARPPGFPHLCQARQPRAGCAVAQKQPALNEIFSIRPFAACSALGL